LIGVIKKRVKDLAEELGRVDWPSKSKVRSATLSVVAVSVLAGAYLWAADVFFAWLSRVILPR
jgi:preprotein translocase SecE subunit